MSVSLYSVADPCQRTCVVDVVEGMRVKTSAVRDVMKQKAMFSSKKRGTKW